MSFAGEKSDFLWIVMTAKKQVSVNVKVNFKDGHVRRRGGTTGNAHANDVEDQEIKEVASTGFDFKSFNLGQGTIKDKKKKIQDYLMAIQ